VKKHRKTVYIRPMPIKSVTYDSSAPSVTLNLARPLTGGAQVTVQTGIVAADGQASDDAFSMIVR
jgi:hypothetical protein